MTIVRLMLALLAVIASAAAESQDYVGWLIYPSVKRSPAVQLPTKQGPWRLVATDRALIAEMPQPVLKNGYVFNFGECRIGGVLRHDVIAMVRHSKAVEWSKDVAAIWIADPKARQFVAGDATGVQCRNESYGV